MDRDLRRIALIALLVLSIVGVAAASAHYVSITQNSDGVVLNETGGPSANLTGNVDVYPESGGVSSDTIQWNTTTGNASFTSSGSTSVTLSKNDLSGSWFNGTDLEVSNAELTIDPANQRKISIQGDADELRFQDAALDDGNVDFIVGAPSGSSTVTVRGLPASTTMTAINESTGNALAVATSDASGTASFSISHSTQTVLLQQGDQSSEPTFSNPSPTGQLQSKQSQLSIDIKDGDMPADTLSVEFFMKKPGASSFSSVGTDTLSNNGTATTSITANAGGQYEWDVKVDDSIGGHSVDTTNQTFQVPNELRIYYEQNPSKLVKNAGTIDITLYGTNEGVDTKSTSSGTVDLTNLDPDQKYIVTAELSGTHTRRVILTSLYDQQEMYLLNTTATTVDVSYELDDKTGDFPPSDTEMRMKKPITKDFDGDGNDETRYQTLLGDTFGPANEFEATVQPNERYDIIVENADGGRRELGEHSVSSGGTRTIPIGEVTISGETEAGTAFAASMVRNNSRYIQFSYIDDQDATSSFTFNITRADGTVFKSNTTISGPLSQYQRTVSVPAGEDDNETYYVRFWADRTDAEDVTDQRIVGGVPDISGGLGVDSFVLEMLGWAMIVGGMGFVVIYDDRLAAMTGVVLATALTWLGLVNIPMVGLGVAGAISVMYLVGREGANR